MRMLILIAAGLLSVICLAPTVTAQTEDSADEGAKKARKPKVEMLTANVRVVDPDGNPIEGATVGVSGLRKKADPSGHWWWSPENFGEPPEKETNANGLVEMPYPKYVTEKLETGQVTWSATHPDFINFRQDFSVDADPAEIQMKRGFKIAAYAIDQESGERLTKNLYAVAGSYGRKWQLKKNGMLVSATMPKKKRFLRVVELVDGKPPRFSERIDIEPGEKRRVLVKDVKLLAGTRVVGKLDESVMRPIKNGYVVAEIIRKPAANDWESRWGWSAKTKIEEDGSFVFESLPTDEVLQMIPVCDGWVPKTPKASEIAPFFPEEAGNRAGWLALPTLIKLEGEEVEATLKMTKAKTVRVTVVGPDDQPIAGAKVGCSPNQKWFDGGSQIYGDGFSTRRYLVESREGDFEYKRVSRYFMKTDENGIAVIANLADSRRWRELYVGHEEFELPISGRGRTFKYEFDDADVTEVTVKLQKRGTEVMDGSQILAEQNQRDTFRRAVETVGGWLQSLLQ